jgi:hypothetical protein
MTLGWVTAAMADYQAGLEAYEAKDWRRQKPMAQNEETKPLFELDLGDNGGQFAPTGIDEVDRWIQDEIEWWQNFRRDLSLSHEKFQKVRKWPSQALQPVREILQTWYQDSQNEESKNLVATVLTELYGANQLIHSQSTTAQFLEDLKENCDPHVVASAFAYLAGHHKFNPESAWEVQGIAEAILHENDIHPGSTASIRSRLQYLRRQFEKLYEVKSEKLDELVTDLGETLNYQQRLRRVSNWLVRRATRKANTVAEEQRKAAEAEWQDLLGTYNAALSLRAPVTYWQNRLVWCRRIAAGMYIAFAALFITLVVVGNFIAPTFKLYALTDGTLSLQEVAIVVLGIAISLALLRIPLRLGSSYLHLANDASERVTMVNTYLALREGGHAMEEQMQTVIERLFLPSQDGIVKDDLIGVTMLDAVTKFRKG